MFGRRGKDAAPAVDETTDDALDALDALEAEDTAEVDGADPTADDAAASPQGPWDSASPPDDGLERLDLGGMLVPVLPGTELRVDVSPEGQVIAATVVQGDSAMQVNAFAAPRTAGIWAEICDEILQSLVESGGTGETTEGPFGLELHANVPAEAPGVGTFLQPARFLGADGPRWFVRALISGPAVSDPAEAALFETVFGAVVVVRGKDAMAPRDPLPLRLPAEALAGQEPVDGQPEQDDLKPFERGPEITEIH